MLTYQGILRSNRMTRSYKCLKRITLKGLTQMFCLKDFIKILSVLKMY